VPPGPRVVATSIVPDRMGRPLPVPASRPANEDETEVAVTTALSERGRRELGRYGDSFLRAWKEPVQTATDRVAG